MRASCDVYVCVREKGRARVMITFGCDWHRVMNFKVSQSIELPRWCGVDQILAER